MTRRKKYAIMRKTRCAKGENAVENLIPRWYRELELFRGVKPLLVLEGCVMDQVRVPVTGSVAEDTLLPLSAFLNAYLSDAGYKQVVFYSNLVGLMNPYAPEMLDNFAKTNQAEVVSGAIPAEFKGNDANTAPNIIRRAMMQGKHATAVVMEMASRYIVTPDRLDQMEVNSFNLLLQASLSAATVRTAQGKLPNLLILLVNKLNDLPAWFYLDNPVCKTITLEAPDRDERMRFLSGSAWPSFFDAAVYRTDMPYYQQHPDDLRKLREKFVGLTEGMSFTELDALRRMSRSQCAPIRDLCSIVDLYTELRRVIGTLFSVKMVILVITLVGCLSICRFFCKVMCPLGAIYGLLNKVSLFHMDVNMEKCIHCGKCTHVCPMDVDPVKTPDSAECIRCGKCVSACPKKALKLGMR